MTRLAVFILALLLVSSLGFCTREDGLPDPPRRELVPCRADAAADDPLACPATSDDSGAAEAAVDAGI